MEQFLLLITGTFFGFIFGVMVIACLELSKEEEENERKNKRMD